MLYSAMPIEVTSRSLLLWMNILLYRINVLWDDRKKIKKTWLGVICDH
jgi:hypothetical protein